MTETTDMMDRKPVCLEKGKRYFGFMPASEVCLHMSSLARS